MAALFSKAQVSYEHPAKGPDHCSECVHWRAPSRCEIVAGRVLAQDWCEQFLKGDTMPARSKAQQAAMAIAEHNPSKLYSKNKGLLQMSNSQLHDFAATSTKNLPDYAPNPTKKRKKFSV